MFWFVVNVKAWSVDFKNYKVAAMLLKVCCDLKSVVKVKSHEKFKTAGSGVSLFTLSSSVYSVYSVILVFFDDFDVFQSFMFLLMLINL